MNLFIKFGIKNYNNSIFFIIIITQYFKIALIPVKIKIREIKGLLLKWLGRKS